MKREVLKAFIQKVWNESNVDAIPEFIADKYTIIHDPGDPWEGMELDIAGFQNRVSTSRAPVPGQYFDIQEMFEQENSVCITWLWRGTHLGEFAGIPPSGKTLHMSGVTAHHPNAADRRL